MSQAPWSTQKLDGFRAAAQSLKLYRRAELEDADTQKSLIKDLYVDPLPEEHVFKTVLRSNTTFLIGRKGTGKSTIFQRVQYELRHMKGYASAYIDIKTVYEAAATDPLLLNQLGGDTLGHEEIEKLRLYRAFIKAVLSAIKDEIKQKLRNSKVEWLKDVLTGSSEDLFDSLDELLRTADEAEFFSVLGIKREERQQKIELSTSQETHAGADLKVAANPTASLNISSKDESSSKLGRDVKYGDVLMRIFNIKDLVLRLKNILNQAQIKHLYVFIDDFSELPEDAMTVFVDTLLAPLNNWSEELIKFKVAAYPHRIYYGQIDKTKIDDINLDLYRLYGTSDVAAMEEKAVEFTKRLVQGRLNHFTDGGISQFVDNEDEALWRLLFYASLGNPRILGYLLYYLQETNLIFGSKIGIRSIRDAAQRYYEDKIEPYFRMNKFLQESFSERASIFSLKELLEQIIVRSRDLRRHRDSSVMREISGVPPTSHFHIAVELDPLLASLELNFFVTKYYEMSDKDGRKVSVYALNFGLCQKFGIAFGRPTERREQRGYFVERVFDNTAIIRKFMQQNQEIKCNNCGKTYELEKLDALRMIDMLCPSCKAGICIVSNLSRKYEALLNAVSPDLLLPPTELGILQILEAEHRKMFAGEIAAELDKSHQLVGRRGKNLAERGLVSRELNPQDRREFLITPLAEASYFKRVTGDELDVPTD
jgi:hypothetical protein